MLPQQQWRCKESLERPDPGPGHRQSKETKNAEIEYTIQYLIPDRERERE